MTCNDKKLIDSPCLRTESYSGFLLAECSVIKRGALALSITSNFNSLCCSHFLFSRSPSSVLGPRIPFALNVLSTNLLNTFLLILTYLFTYLPNNLASFLLTYLLYTQSLFTQSLTDSFTFTYYRKHNYYSLHRNCNRIE